MRKFLIIHTIFFLNRCKKDHNIKPNESESLDMLTNYCWILFQEKIFELVDQFQFTVYCSKMTKYFETFPLLMGFVCKKKKILQWGFPDFSVLSLLSKKNILFARWDGTLNGHFLEVLRCDI